MGQLDEGIHLKAGQFMQVHPKVQKERFILGFIQGLIFPSDSSPEDKKGTSVNRVRFSRQ